ncbi:hypothetical protein GB937_005164 [Aspergillus fischeri]|nr:hypothetical protein GB937_005164 [Aspergillus fischeri]
MVVPRTVLSGLLALGLVGSGLAGNTDSTVTYESPIIESWDGEETNLTISFDVVGADYAHLYNITNVLAARTGITTKVAVAQIASVASQVIMTAGSAVTIYEFIASIMKAKSEPNLCALAYGTDSNGTHTEGYAYKATTTGSNCETTAEKKTLLSAMEKCANALHTKGAVWGCCTMHHGGTWHGHLRLSGDPTNYLVMSVTY